MKQSEVLDELREAIDAARGPVPNSLHRKVIRRLIREHPEQVRSFRVLYNLGRERREWLLALMEHDAGKPRDVLLGADSPWLDDNRANGPVVGGHNEDPTTT